MKTIYPYDPDANLASNRVTDSVSTTTYPNAFKVVVPESAPFYRFDLEVHTTDNRLLIEGLDYYLAYYSKDISEATGKPVYGGIMLFDVDAAEVTLRAVGGNHMVPASEVGRFLTDPELAEPRNVDWSELQRYPTTVEPVDKPDNLEEALEQDVVVKALDGVRQNIVDKIAELDDRYDDVIAEITAVANKLYDHGLWTHHKQPHRHNYTRADLSALGVNETAVDAVKAYGLTLQQLVDEMVTFGINQDRIDDLLGENLTQTIKGRLNVDSGSLTFRHKNDDAKMVLNGYRLDLETATGEIVYETDTDANEAGIGLEIAAGFNTLLVPSSGSGQGDHPSFNGKILISTDNILDFLYKPESGTANVHSEDTSTLELQGRGVQSSPFKAKAIPPIATSSVTGLWKITDSLLITGDGYGISQWALTQIRNALDGYVDKSYTVNGEVFGDDESVVLTKSHIGLPNAQDTAPDDKPVTNALTSATAGKSTVDHTHQKSDLNGVPAATNSVEGIGMVHSTLDETTNKFAVAKLAEDLRDTINDVEKDIAGRAKAGIASATYFGGDGYLPIPALGNYGHANYKYPALFGEEEGNNKFVFLTSGASSFGFGVYYNELQLSENGDIVTQNRSSVEYAPDFLVEAGTTAQYVVCGTSGIFRLVDSANTSWIILTRGTMDMTKHIGTTTESLGNNWRPLIHKEFIYLIGYWSSRNLHMGCKRARLQDLYDGKHIVWEDITLSGKDVYGNDVSGTTINFAPVDMSTDPNVEALIYRNDNGKWSGIDPSHASQNTDVQKTGNLARIFAYHRPYISNSYSSSGGSPWTDSTTINLDDHTFVIEDAESIRCELTEATMLTPGGTNNWYGITPNNTSMRVMGKKFMLSGYWYGSSYPQRATVYKRDPDVDDIEYLKRNIHPTVATRSTVHVGGVQPTVVNVPMCDMAWRDDNTLLYYDNVTGYNEVLVDPDVPYPGDDGLGPTTHRISSPIGRSKLNRIPRVCVDSPYNEGLTLVPGERRPSKHEDLTFSNEYVFDSTNGTAAREACRQAAIDEGLLIADRIINDSLMLIVFGDPLNPIKQFLSYSNYQYSTADRTSKKVMLHLFEVDMSVSGDVITVDAGTLNKLSHGTITGSATSHSTGINGYGTQSIAYPTSDGGWHFAIQNGFYSGWVGWGGYGIMRHTERPDGTSHTTYTIHNNSYCHRYYLHHPKLGLMELSYSSSGDAIRGNKMGTTADEIIANTKFGSCVVLSTRAAEGWIVYFTQDLPFYAEEKLYTIEAEEFDLRVEFPNAYANRTFYFHADVTDGVPKYTIDDAILPDTPTRLWIGHVTTDDERIIDLVVDRARRLGNIAPLLQHAHNKYAHGYDFSDTLVSSEYSLLENKGMIHDFDVISFKDVFDTWYRFSHSGSGNYPANPGELEQWRYLEATDTIENLTNSSTFIGFISDKMAGDYIFNTVVSSNNNDDDGIFIILGAFKQGDIDSKEHTLSLQMNTGGFGINTPYICIQKNHGQPGLERIYTLDPNSDGSNTGRGWSPSDGYEVFHVYAVREKNRLLVYVKRSLLPKVSGVAYDTIVGNYVDSVRGLQIADFEEAGYLVADLDLATVAPEFARATRFGYGSQSQPYSRFWNIERPLSNLDEFYSSEQMVLESMSKADGMVKKLYGSTSTASVGAITATSNYAYKTWPKAMENVYGGSSSGNYARPPGAKYVSPQPVWSPAANHAFYLCKEIDLNIPAGEASPLLKLRTTADDQLNLYVDGSHQGQIGAAAPSDWAKRFTAGKHRLMFKCTNIPANSPSFAAFTVFDELGGTIDVSDESWYCDSGYGGNTNIKVAKITYAIDADVEDTFVVQRRVSSEGNAPCEVCPAEYEVQDDGTIEVSRYIDVTNGDATWEVTMIKKKI